MVEKAVYKITITNFSKHNSQIKKSHKYTLISNGFCSDAKIRNMPMTSRWLFLNLVLTCGNSGHDTFEISSSSLRNMLECNRSIVRVLDELQSFRLLTFEKTFDAVRVNRNEMKLKEKNIIDGLDKKPPKPEKLNLESAYNLFPKKEGKAAGLRTARKLIKSPKDLDDLKVAVCNYVSKKQGVEKQYLLHFSTFMNQWRDWLDPETGTSMIQRSVAIDDSKSARVIAQKLLDAVKKFPPADPQTKDFLGENNFKIYLKIGRPTIANLPDNNFGINELIAKVKTITEHKQEKENHGNRTNDNRTI